MAPDTLRHSSHSVRSHSHSHLSSSRGSVHDYEEPIKLSSSTSSRPSPSSRRFKSTSKSRSPSSSRARRTFSSEAEAARAKRDRRIERAVESAVTRRAEREARQLGTDAESVARRLRQQREEASLWREMEEAKRRIAKDRAGREARAGGSGTSTRSLASARTSRSTGDYEPALSGWVNKRKDERKKSALRSKSVAARDSESVTSVRRTKSALRASSRSRSRHGSVAGRSRDRRSYHDSDDDVATVSTDVSSRSLKSVGSVGRKIRSLNFHKSSSRSRSGRSDDDALDDKVERRTCRSGKKKSSSSRRIKSRDDENDDPFVTSMSSRQKSSSKSISRKKSDDSSVKSGRSSRSLRGKSKSRKGDDIFRKSGRSSRSIKSGRSSRSIQTNDGKKDVKISRHARYHRSRSRESLKSQELCPGGGTSLLQEEVVRLKLKIAEARTEEEDQRHRARRLADVNDGLRALLQQNKERATNAKDDVNRLKKELNRLHKLKAKIAPQIKESRIKAWKGRRRPSTDDIHNSGTRSRPRSNIRGDKRQSFASGGSMSSWSIGESLYSVQSLFDRVERGIMGLEDEAVGEA